MRTIDIGRILFALSLAVLGGLLVGVHGFGDVWPTVPKGFVWHDPIVMLTGIVLLTGGAALVAPRTARIGAMVLAGFFAFELAVLKLPHVVAHPMLMAVYEDGGETVACLGGALTILAMLRAGAWLRVGQLSFGLALIPFGLAHFIYLDQTAPLIPAWLPFHATLAYLTGAAYIAAGLSILAKVLAPLAATLTAAMVSLFTLIIWVPAIVTGPKLLGNWSELCVSTAISGAAWAVAASFTTPARGAPNPGNSAGPA
ncbi:MAG TPA: hypothetical protein VG387_10335 [Rhizomicrobium sp.]|jgi:uncharacterized membrane protein|nr:hypothetical protein [Rhizomicrobium sp.]